MKTILVPTDFSKNAGMALRYAIHLSRITGAGIRVLNCYQYSSYQHLISETEQQRELLIKKDAEEQLKKLQKYVYKAYRAMHLNVPADIKIQAEFNPFVVEETIAVAKKINAGLIVMGTHGATGVQKFLFGSNTSSMVAKSPIPVLAIPEGYRYRPIKSLLFASDLQDFNVALKQVVDFAKDISAAIQVLYLEYADRSWTARENEIMKIIHGKKDINISVAVEEADARYSLVKQLRNYTASKKPGCLVMFTKERGFWQRLMHESKTEELSCALPVPLLSFRK